jgi:hypothetical protein
MKVGIIDLSFDMGDLMNEAVKVTVIDGQGGQLGAQLVKEIIANFPRVSLTAIGTNAAATSAMLKAGAKNAATGENPVIVACRNTDVIIGPVGIVIADSLLGEITPKMAVAVGQSRAVRILVPMNKCDSLVAGVSGLTVSTVISDVVLKLKSITDPIKPTE